ncbi:MAG: decaprenyl-phosphate phosphoribosyltransferase [Ilumatobacteraceae bacterium]
MMFRPLLQAMRPRQWVKNVLVGAAPAAAGVTATTQWLDVLLAFISMTCAASGVYLFNDVADIAEDRLHPKKIDRPVASGALSVRLATIAGGVLTCTSMVLAAVFINWVTAALVAGYLALMGLYSVVLRNVIGVDIIIVAGGFVLRALIGASAASIAVSSVFVIFIGCAALFIVSGKRLSEVNTFSLHHAVTTPHRPTLRQYSRTSLWLIICIASAGMVLAYIVWVATTPLARRAAQTATIPFVIIALIRMLAILRQGGGDEPEVLLYRDRSIQCCAIGWTVAFLLAEYGS